MTDVLGNALNFRYELLLPEIVIALTAVAILFLDAFKAEFKVGYRALPLLAVAGLVAAGGL
ncbi:MAG: hypothetical protein Q7K37_12650, partial [Dehalococcoidia bacterium]|nr:hypothetical protein [Dehalococcoidia bacterium]